MLVPFWFPWLCLVLANKIVEFKYIVFFSRLES